MPSRRKQQERHHALAAEGVRAYLLDEDADLYNITDAAVTEDPLAAAWNLTALAAAAVEVLAERTGMTATDALADVVQRGYGGLRRAPQPAKDVRPSERPGG